MSVADCMKGGGGLMGRVWLFLACVLGLAWSVVYAADFVLGEPLLWPAGRLMFAFYGCLIYGGVLPSVFNAVSGGSRSCVMMVSGWLWHVSVALGVAGIWMGDGSGLLLMPFDWWICPVFFVVSGMMACRVWGSALPWMFRLLFCTAMGGWAASLMMLWAGRGLGMNSLMDVAALEASLIRGIAVVAAGLAVQRTGLPGGRWFSGGMIWLSLTLAFAPLIGGLGYLQGFPVPWVLTEAGLIWSWAFAAPVAVFAGWLWLSSATCSGGGIKMGYTALAGLAVWSVFSEHTPELVQFSLSSWFGPELWLLISTGLLWQVGGPVRAFLPRWLWTAGICGVFGAWAAGVFASIDLISFPHARWAELMSGWVGVTSCIHAGAMLLCIAAIPGWSREREHASLKCEAVFCGKGHGVMATFVVLAILLVAGSGFLTHHRNGSSLEVKRPGQDAEGSRIYAAEGCALCHTQVIRRSMSGRDWQIAIDRGTDPDFPYRVTEPEDVDSEFNREGAAQLGVAAIGPDLSNAAEYVAGRLEYEDAVVKGTRRAAQGREWMALHLYNPREGQFKRAWSVCSAMPGLFEYRRISGATPSVQALPVRTESGWELIPNQRGERLLNYLESLRRLEPSLKRGEISSAAALAHIHPDYRAHPPAVDMEGLKRARAAAVMEKGRNVFLSKCSICHGNDGLGDKVTYPPLAGSEWLKEKPVQEIVKIITQGLTGPITVAGKEWNSTMLPPGITDPKDIADLMTFLRRHFGGLEQETYSKEQMEDILKKIK